MSHQTDEMNVSKAFRMMMRLGFDVETIRTVFTRVVKKYNNWTLIFENLEEAMRVSVVDDITNGRENMSISLLKDSPESVIPDFNYIRNNIAYDSVHVQVSIARIADDDCCGGCNGNCLSSCIPCACSRDTGGEFAYTREGLLSEKFLKACILSKQNNNRDKKFIRECWIRCGCTMQCGNRVVQRGINRKLQVFWTGDSKGWGVRTLEKLPAGAFICEYIGEILTNTELHDRNQSRLGEKHTYPVLLDADSATEAYLNDDALLCLDGTNYGNVARFMNHSCFDGNMIDIPVQVETPDRLYYHLAFFTTREVNAGEELTWDYGIEFEDKNHPIEAFQCNCGSANCKGVQIPESTENQKPESESTRRDRKRKR